MTRALAPIADRLGKLLKLLTSDQDGEVVAAARKLNRTLENAGLDIHALADHVTNNRLPETEVRKIYDRGFAEGRKAEQQQRQVQVVNGFDDEPSWHAIACECQAKPQRLRGERELEFVADMVRRTVLGGELSEKQEKWLRDIYVRVRR